MRYRNKGSMFKAVTCFITVNLKLSILGRQTSLSCRLHKHFPLLLGNLIPAHCKRQLSVWPQWQLTPYSGVGCFNIIQIIENFLGEISLIWENATTSWCMKEQSLVSTWQVHQLILLGFHAPLQTSWGRGVEPSSRLLRWQPHTKRPQVTCQLVMLSQVLPLCVHVSAKPHLHPKNHPVDVWAPACQFRDLNLIIFLKKERKQEAQEGWFLWISTCSEL